MTSRGEVRRVHSKDRAYVRSLTRGRMQSEGVDDVRLDGLEVKDHACPDDGDGDVRHDPVYACAGSPACHEQSDWKKDRTGYHRRCPKVTVVSTHPRGDCMTMTGGYHARSLNSGFPTPLFLLQRYLYEPSRI